MLRSLTLESSSCICYIFVQLFSCSLLPKCPKCSNRMLLLRKGAHIVRERIADGREAARALLALQRLQRLRGLAPQGDQQEWQESLGMSPQIDIQHVYLNFVANNFSYFLFCFIACGLCHICVESRCWNGQTRANRKRFSKHDRLCLNCIYIY